MDFDVHIADSVSEDLLDIIRCKYWFIDLSLYLLHVNNGDGKELVKAVKSYAFFREKTEEADYCRSLIEFSADNLRNGPTFYSCTPEYMDYLKSGGKASMTYEAALQRLEFERKCNCPFNPDNYEVRLKFINELKKFRSTVYEYLIDKEKPEGELLSPKQVLHVIAKFFAYEVVFCEPLF